MQLATMYAIAALHKMNDDFWDPATSCSSQVAATVFAQWAPGGILGTGRAPLTPSALARAAVRASPAAALVLDRDPKSSAIARVPSVWCK